LHRGNAGKHLVKATVGDVDSLFVVTATELVLGLPEAAEFAAPAIEALLGKVSDVGPKMVLP
jgi:hypothetical protein